VNPGPGEPPVRDWGVERIAEVASRLVAVDVDDRPGPVLVAVDGRSAGGKTTTAARLAAHLPGAVVVHTDDVAWHHAFFDWADLLVTGVLDPLQEGRQVAFRPPAWRARGREGAIEVPAGTRTVLLEGVGAGRRELADRLDRVVWVQSDRPLAQARGIERDGGDQAAVAFWQEWEAEEVPFLLAQRPWERADLLVHGTPDVRHDPATELVTAPGPLVRR
jgi:hypothetical protein